MKLQPGDIGFSMNKNSWLSKAIAWFMGSKWSHTFVVLEHADGRAYTVETSDYEVVIHTVEFYEKNPDFVFEIYRANSLEPVQRKMVANECLKQLGITYGYLQLISLGLRRLLMRIGLSVPNFFRQGVVCCGVALYGYTKTNIEGLMGIDPESIDTEEVYQKVISLTDKSGKLIFEKVLEKNA